MDDDYIDWVVDLNLKSVLRCSREAAAVMPAGSTIVAVASVLARVPQPGSALYTATKAAVVALMKGLAVELGPRGIRAVSVSPGDIDTESSVAPAPDSSPVARGVRASVLGRRGAAAEVAAAVAFLLGSDASYITGTDLLVDGGYLLT
jgi:3-oxoacyl-[acyl-carrier protein] reductase